MTGKLITIEGIHGCGKSAISSMLFNTLDQSSVDVVLAVDQSDQGLSGKIRKINLEETDFIEPVTEALLIAAARRQNIIGAIRPNLKHGKIVICERYNDAFFAFQHYARELPSSFVECVGLAIAEGLEPNLTILLDLDPQIALARIKDTNRHRIEREDFDFHKKVREGYLQQLQKYPTRIKLVNADMPIKNVFDNVYKLVMEAL
jgi:dTMP kinase